MPDQTPGWDPPPEPPEQAPGWGPAPGPAEQAPPGQQWDSTAYPGGSGWDASSGQAGSGADQAAFPQARKRRRWLRPVVSLGIVGAVVGGGAVVDAVTSADRDQSGAVVGAGDVSSADVEIGDCLIDPREGEEGGEVDDVRAVPCTDAHDLEVYALGTLTGGAFPSDEELDLQAGQTCFDGFEGYVGVPFEESRLDLGYITPGEDAWDAGDREVSCFLFELDGSQRTESARDTEV